MADISLESILEDIDFIFSKYDCWLSEDSFKFHQNLQLAIGNLSKKYDLIGILEYPVSNRGDGNKGHIDVVWISYLGTVVAFELDKSPRKKSIFKLSNIQADLKIWVYYGKESALLNKFDFSDFEDITIHQKIRGFGK